MAKKAKPVVDDVVSPRIIMVPNESTPLYYVNFMEAANTANDFTLFFARLPPKLSEEKLEELKTKKTIHIEPDVQVVIPVSLVPAIIVALTTQKETYERLIGQKIQEPEMVNNPGK
jgi:hypothetical protein